jgi:large subunit ribosomal protein L15e
MRAVERVEKPLRMDRARALGYKAQQGYVVALVRVRRGGFSKPRPRSGRRPKAIGVVRHKVNVSIKEEAVQRFRKHFPNLKPLGAYPLAQDSLYRWYEVVALDPSHPAVKAH